jgi:hypothetical protein
VVYPQYKGIYIGGFGRQRNDLMLIGQFVTQVKWLSACSLIFDSIMEIVKVDMEVPIRSRYKIRVNQLSEDKRRMRWIWNGRETIKRNSLSGRFNERANEERMQNIFSIISKVRDKVRQRKRAYVLLLILSKKWTKLY